MSACLAHRGPDAGGLYSTDARAYGHRRLSIIGLDARSHQPMLDPELGIGIVFNGCIYNYRELRAELQNLGYRFFSSGDTEVILKAYHAWGSECVVRLVGMFAFALWERDSGKTILVRDRLGIKPLYYAEIGTTFRFASTLPALLAGGGIDTSIDPVALHYYMSLHAVVPPPRTILQGVKKLAPATIMEVDADGSRKSWTYWQAKVGRRTKKLQLHEWVDELRAALRTSVARRRVADVPVGVLLSGGLDSSLVVALLAEQGHNDLKTFSIGFDTVRNVEGDEFSYSDLVAREFGTDHLKMSIDAGRTLEALPEAVSAMSEPMMSHDAVGFYLLSQEVSKHVRVVQSGQGADEIFGGYFWYQHLVGSDDPVSDYASIYFDRDHAEMEVTLSPNYLSDDYSRKYVSHYISSAPGSPVDKVLQLDTEVMLVDDPVKRVDNMTMAFGLEARVPFLDHDVVELAAQIPWELKVANGGKHILKEAARGIVPDQIIDRPKGYFPVPALKYISGRYLELIQDVLSESAVRKRGLFNPSYVRRLLEDPEKHLTPKGHSKLWQVAVLELWLQQNGI